MIERSRSVSTGESPIALFEKVKMAEVSTQQTDVLAHRALMARQGSGNF